MNRAGLMFALACALPATAAAARFEAFVSRVSDGDTVWVRPLDGGPPQQVRIAGIDAPELCQPFGEEARGALAARILRKRVTVDTSGHDDWRRLLGRIEHAQQDVGGWMVGQGYAWSYRFRGDPGPYAREFRGQNGPCPAPP